MNKKIVTSIKIATFLTVIVMCAVLSQNETFAITQLAGNTYEGIDVSLWQGYIDYSQVEDSGIEIVYIKASQGSTIKDPYFEINYENAKANGLKVGFYHFVTATSTRRSGTRSQVFCISNIWKRSRL